MCIWKDTKASFKWLNEIATLHDFETINDLLTRMTDSIVPEVRIRVLFDSKNGYIFVAAFKAFTEMGMDHMGFGGFCNWFADGGKNTKIDGKTWDMLDDIRSTRDVSVVHGKLNYLVALIGQYMKENQKAA